MMTWFIVRWSLFKQKTILINAYEITCSWKYNPRNLPGHTITSCSEYMRPISNNHGQNGNSFGMTI